MVEPQRYRVLLRRSRPLLSGEPHQLVKNELRTRYDQMIGVVPGIHQVMHRQPLIQSGRNLDQLVCGNSILDTRLSLKALKDFNGAELNLSESLDRLVYSTQMRGEIPREFRRIHTMSASTSKGTALTLVLPPGSAPST